MVGLDEGETPPQVVVHLTKQHLEEIINRAAEKAAKDTIDEAQQRFVYQVGIGVLKKAALVIGVGILIFGLWLAGKDLPR
jgi:hypothetical protein